MLQIRGKEQIVLPNVKRMEVSDITTVGDPANPTSYQRVLVFVTNQGILKLSIEALDYNTLCKALEEFDNETPFCRPT